MPHIKIDNNRCKSCYLCIDACPKSLIKKSDVIGKTGECTVKFEDIQGQCIGCANCAMVCPDIAIVSVEK